MSGKIEFDYMREAARTRSSEFHGRLVETWRLQIALDDGIRSAEVLDGFKRALFYGARAPGIPDDWTAKTETLGEFRDDHAIGLSNDLIHGILGVFTEAGELLSVLANPLPGNSADKPEGGEFPDVNNIREEVGDLFWYCALIADACGFTLDDAQRKNIQKLRTRYPDKFTSEKALKRDLAAERAVLEKADPFVGGTHWRHYKNGDRYELLTFGVNEATGEKNVLYRNASGTIYILPESEFFGTVESPVFPDGYGPRFSSVEGDEF